MCNAPQSPSSQYVPVAHTVHFYPSARALDACTWEDAYMRIWAVGRMRMGGCIYAHCVTLWYMYIPCHACAWAGAYMRIV